MLILIADDEAPILSVLAAMVKDIGHSPILAGDGQQALEKARDTWSSLVITDLMMPRLNGAQLIAALRKEPLVSEPASLSPVSILTAASWHSHWDGGACCSSMVSVTGMIRRGA